MLRTSECSHQNFTTCSSLMGSVSLLLLTTPIPQQDNASLLCLATLIKLSGYTGDWGYLGNSAETFAEG